mgnify:CR=1 FL=1
MNQQEFRSRVRKLQDLIDGELRRRGVDPINQHIETRETRYIEMEDYSDFIDAEFWEIPQEPVPAPRSYWFLVEAFLIAGLTAGLLAGAL